MKDLPWGRPPNDGPSIGMASELRTFNEDGIQLKDLHWGWPPNEGSSLGMAYKWRILNRDGLQLVQRPPWKNNPLYSLHKVNARLGGG